MWGNNYRGKDLMLMGPNNFDFRPQKGSL